MREGTGRRIVGGIAIGVLVVLLLAAIYAFTLGPGHSANLQTEIADGQTATEIASEGTDLGVITVTPAEYWQVQPLVRQLQVPLVRDLPKPPLPNDPRIALGRHEGIRLTSPDAGFDVQLTVLPAGADAETDVDAVWWEWREDETEISPLATETLASGATLYHFSESEQPGKPGQRLIGALDLEGTVVRVEAEVRSSSAGMSLDDYRPALSALLESVTAE